MIIVVTGNRSEVERYVFQELDTADKKLVIAYSLHPDEEYNLATRLIDEAKNENKDIFVVTYSVFLIDVLMRLTDKNSIDFKILTICQGKTKEVNPISTYIPCLSDIYFKFYLNQDPSYPNRGSE